jgi:hypothetical protein
MPDHVASTILLLEAVGVPGTQAQLTQLAGHYLTRPHDLYELSEAIDPYGWDPDDDGDPAPVPQDDDLPIAA